MTGWSAASAVPDAALTARFAAALARLNPGGARIGLAVSGGPDSLATLLLAHAAIPGGFAVATVNHGLRAEAADECALVAAACTERGVECAVLPVVVAPGNVQAEARRARYRALADWVRAAGLAAVATAHHADDQAETLLLRLNRGSGIAGLAGVRETGEVAGLRVIRPLLGFRRAELAGIVAGTAVADDPSNADPRFDRVRLRQALAGADWIDPLALARSAQHLAEAEAALDWAARREWDEAVREDGGALTYRPAAPRAVVLLVVARIIARLGQPPRGGDVARLVEALEAGRGGNLGGVLAVARKDGWRFGAEPGRM